DWSQTKFNSFQRSLDNFHTSIHTFFGELDDQNRVLGSETNECDKTDLRIDVVRQVRKQRQRKNGTKCSDWYSKENRKRHRPAFVKCSEEEEHKHHRDGEDESRAASGCDLFAAHTTELVAVSGGENFGCYFAQCIDRLTTTVSRCCRSRDFRRAINIVMGNERRCFDDLRCDQRAEWHHSSRTVTHVVFTNFSDVLSERSVCLRYYAEVTSVQVEVVDITATEVT